ncbi:Sphingomyelin phosphodiesterase [Olea europaea subsp. europaea]|uniref:Sphingomyelin phosphodiesterase n=1 Tax=Olea europaea subsp. europaea TaxID=158383 RepID=A0A8S0THK9_OLEEU|nr:Sphingomyelin phosphodiesterase [Olea europaea subsp. europaea]
MNPHSYMQTKSTELAETIAAAATAVQISAACSAVESFLRKHAPDQQRWFFSITFPTLICRIFGFDESASSSGTKRTSLSGWIDIAASTDDSELDGKIFSLLSPNGVLLSSISAVDRLSLVKYIFPAERLPEWVRCMLQIKSDCQVLTDLCPLFKNKVMKVLIKGSSNQVQLNVFEYYMFWFAYCPVSRGNSEGSVTVKIQQMKKFRLDKWAYSIPGLSSNKRGEEKKTATSFYLRLLYSYLRSFVPAYDLNVHQPYHSSLLHYSPDYDISLIERAEFLVNTLIYFWLLDNDFSPFPVGLCKSFGLRFSFRSVLGESPPNSGLGAVVNVFVKYLNLISLPMKDEFNQIENIGSSSLGVPGSVNVVKSRDAALSVHSVGSWNSWVQRPLYRYILREFLFYPVETSVKNASQVFTLWVSYMEPWMITFEEFTDLDKLIGMPTISSAEVFKSSPHGYSSSWRGFVLLNYLFYSSLVMHFIGFAHKFLHTDAEVIVQMVAKVINILTSSMELKDLIKNVDTAFHSKQVESSRSHLNTLNRFVPTIRQQLQDWEDGLCETDADGSFLHENWNKDLRLFSDGEDGGQQLLQV